MTTTGAAGAAAADLCLEYSVLDFTLSRPNRQVLPVPSLSLYTRTLPFTYGVFLA